MQRGPDKDLQNMDGSVTEVTSCRRGNDGRFCAKQKRIFRFLNLQPILATTNWPLQGMQRLLHDWHLLLAAPVGWGGGPVEGDSGGDPLEINRHAPCPSDNKESEWCLSENQELRSPPLFWCAGHLGCGFPSALGPRREEEKQDSHRSRPQEKQCEWHVGWDPTEVTQQTGHSNTQEKQEAFRWPQRARGESHSVVSPVSPGQKWMSLKVLWGVYSWWWNKRTRAVNFYTVE